VVSLILPGVALGVSKNTIYHGKAKDGADVTQAQGSPQLEEDAGRKTRRAMVRATALGLAAGAILLFYLLKKYHWQEILQAVAAAGWGVLWVSAYRFVTIATEAAGWRELWSPEAKPQILPLWLIRWIGEAVNSLFPVAQVGGAVVRARLLGEVQDDFVSAAAATIVDFTIGVFAQAVYTILGIALLFRAAHSPVRGLNDVLLAVVGFLILALAALYAAQRHGVLQKLAGTLQKTLAGSLRSITGQVQSGAQALDAALKELYARRSAIARCTAWRLAATMLYTGETWLAMHFLGAEVSWSDALILESLGRTVRSMAFPVPAGLGVQEGGFLLIGSALGIAPPLSLALSLVKRAREILVGLPGLAAWGLLEGKKIRRAG